MMEIADTYRYSHDGEAANGCFSVSWKILKFSISFTLVFLTSVLSILYWNCVASLWSSDCSLLQLLCWTKNCRVMGGKRKWKGKPEGGETSLQSRIDFLSKSFFGISKTKKFISITNETHWITRIVLVTLLSTCRHQGSKINKKCRTWEDHFFSSLISIFSYKIFLWSIFIINL